MKFRATFSMVIVFAISGCTSTPLTQIENFAESTAKLTDATDQVIEEYNSVTINEQLQTLKTTHFKTTNPADQRLLSLDELAAIENVYGSDAKKKLSIYRANKSLNDYATAIKALAQAGQRQDISDASVEMVGSLSEMEASLKDLKGADYKPYFDKKKLGSIAATIDLIGSELADSKRKKALKKIITDANPHITQLVDVVVTQLDALNYEMHLNDYSYAALNRRIMDYNNRVARGEYTAKPDKQFEDLLTLWKQTQAHVVNSKKFNHLKVSLRSIASEHEKIALAVSNDQFSSEEIVDAVKNLQDKRKRFDEFKEAIITCDEVGFNSAGEPICKDKELEPSNEA